MDSIVTKTTSSDSLPPISAAENVPQVLLGYCLYDLRRSGYIRRLPDVTKAEIVDKSKESLFVKLIAIVQVLWNMIEVVTRLVTGLPISQLKVAVVAFSWCAIITYAALLQKPQGVGVPLRPIKCHPTSVDLVKSHVPDKQDRRRSVISHQNLMVTEILRDYLPNLSIRGTLSDFDWTYVPNDALDLQMMQKVLGFIAISGVAFGSVHCAGWNLGFKTEIE